jgi:hypothetical protein
VNDAVIAGGGLAAQRCAEALRRGGHDGRIRIVCDEPHRPYDRPPLSKEILAEARAEEALGFRPAGWYEEMGVELLLGMSAVGLDGAARRLTLSDGSSLRYHRLLIATGSRPRRLPMLERFANVTTLRTLDDARRLRGALAAGGHLAVVGAGFIGQEVAAASRPRSSRPRAPRSRASSARPWAAGSHTCTAPRAWSSCSMRGCARRWATGPCTPCSSRTAGRSSATTWWSASACGPTRNGSAGAR